MKGNDSGADQQPKGHQLVVGANLVDVFRHSPGRRVGVIRLDGGTAPGRAAVAISKELAISIDDGNHDTIVDKSSQDGTVNLGKEHDARGDFDYIKRLRLVYLRISVIEYDLETPTIFSHFQVTAEVDCICNDVV